MIFFRVGRPPTLLCLQLTPTFPFFLCPRVGLSDHKKKRQGANQNSTPDRVGLFPHTHTPKKTHHHTGLGTRPFSPNTHPQHAITNLPLFCPSLRELTGPHLCGRLALIAKKPTALACYHPACAHRARVARATRRCVAPLPTTQNPLCLSPQRRVYTLLFRVCVLIEQKNSARLPPLLVACVCCVVCGITDACVRGLLTQER